MADGHTEDDESGAFLRRWEHVIALVGILVAVGLGVGTCAMASGDGGGGGRVSAGTTTTAKRSHGTTSTTSTTLDPLTTTSTTDEDGGPPTSGAGGDDGIGGEVFLADIDPVRGSSWYTEPQLKIDGVFYDHAVYAQIGSCGGISRLAEYSIDRRYDSFTTVIGVTDKSASAAPVKVEIFGDGKSLWTDTVQIGKTKDVHLDVTGILRLKLVATKEFDQSSTCVFPSLGDPKLTGSGTRRLSDVSGDAALADVDPVSGSSWYTEPQLKIDGVVYDHAIYAQIGSCGGTTRQAEYSIDRQYGTLATVVGVTDASASDAPVKIEVLADGKAIWTGTVQVGAPKDVRLDVSDALRLEVRATQEFDASSTCVFPSLGDPSLS
jgi:hypothetical protein